MEEYFSTQNEMTKTLQTEMDEVIYEQLKQGTFEIMALLLIKVIAMKSVEMAMIISIMSEMMETR